MALLDGGGGGGDDGSDGGADDGDDYQGFTGDEDQRGFDDPDPDESFLDVEPEDDDDGGGSTSTTTDTTDDSGGSTSDGGSTDDISGIFGDPAGDTDRTDDDGGTSTDTSIEERISDTAPSTGGDGPTTDIAPDDTDGGDTTTGPTLDDIQDSDPVEPEQGIEVSGATESVEAQAQELEEQILEENPQLSEEDVAISLVGTQEGVVLQSELTEGAEERVAAEQIEQQLAGTTEQIGDLRVPTGQLAGTAVAVDLTPEDVRETEEGFTLTEDALDRVQDELAPPVDDPGPSDPLPDAEDALEQELEERVGRIRAEAGGIVNPTLREGVIEGTDLDAGEDFTIQRDEEMASLELTEQFERQLTADVLEGELREEGTLVDLDPDADLQETDEGLELSPEGRTKIATTPLTDFVEESKGFLGGLGVTLPTFEQEPVPGPRAGERTVTGTERLELGDIDLELERTEFGERGATPGPGAAPRAREGQEPILEPGPLAQDVGAERDLGHVPILVPQFGEREQVRGPRTGARERLEPKPLEQVLAETQERIDEAIEVDRSAALEGREPARGRAGAALRTEQELGQDSPLGELFLERTLESPGTFAVGAVGLGKDLLDVTAEVTEAATPELGERETIPGPRAGERATLEEPDLGRIPELGGDIAQSAVNLGAVGASRAIENPGRTAAAGAGTLLGSAAIFGGAAAVGPRTSLATRAAIQPGEEALGFGGFGITRRLAGERRAQQLFPNREPLIFSEEAAIRAGRRLGRGVQERLPRMETVSERVPEIDVRQSTRDAIQEVRLEAIRTREAVRRPETFAETRPLTGPLEVSESELEENEIVVIEDFGDDLRPMGDPEPAEFDPEGDVEPEDPGAGGSVGSGGSFEFDVERRTEGGVVRERVEAEPGPLRMDMPSEMELRSEALRRGQLDTRRRFESALDMGEVGEVSDVGPVLAGEQAPTFDPEEVLGPTLDMDQEFRLGQREVFREPGELEREAELTGEIQRLEPLQELELRAEQELETELEKETRREIEAFGFNRDRDRRDVFAQDRDEFEKLFEEDILTPGGALSADDGLPTGGGLMAGDDLAGDNT